MHRWRRWCVGRELRFIDRQRRRRQNRCFYGNRSHGFLRHYRNLIPASGITYYRWRDLARLIGGNRHRRDVKENGPRERNPDLPSLTRPVK
jgi:hypothetical protein